MNNINDKDIDMLITSVFERQQLTEEISKSVIKELKRKSRKAQWLSWTRLMGFAFGLPLLAACFAYLLHIGISCSNISPLAYPCLVFPMAAMVYCMTKQLSDFSISE